jgi:signal transduction histidine kinase
MQRSESATLRFLRRLKTFPGGIAYLDQGLVFSFCNDVQASCFGRRAEDVIGRPLQDVVPNNPDFWRHLQRVALTGERDPQATLSVTWPDRSEKGEHNFVVSYIADLDRRGHVQGIFMTALEVTTSILREREELRERNKALEEIIKERDLLVGILSHEVRAPLATIFGNAHLLLRRLDDLDENSRTQAINDIRTEAERLNRLAENMLLLARAGARAPVPTEPVILQRTIAEVAFDQRKSSSDRCIVVSVKPTGLLAEAQPEYLRQVLQNLVGNAEKYSAPHQPIDIRARRHGEEVRISVLDRGPGIDPAEAEIIFQPFYRSPRTATKVAGSGIGLAVCKLLVQAQSGSISARPRRGGGSVFSFSLPAVK